MRDDFSMLELFLVVDKDELSSFLVLAVEVAAEEEEEEDAVLSEEPPGDDDTTL